MTSTERLNRSSDGIKDSRRTMLETEDVGVMILQDLHSQRQSLLHAHHTVTLPLALTFFLFSFSNKMLFKIYFHIVVNYNF